MQTLICLSMTTASKLEQLVNILVNKEHQPPLPPPPPPPPNHQPRPPQITLPNFDGSNPLDWIFQANNYFDYYNMPNNQRLPLAIFYFTGEALS